MSSCGKVDELFFSFWVKNNFFDSKSEFLFKIEFFSDCVELQDPYCAWDKIAGKCRSHGAPRWLDETYFYSEVSTGKHSACPSGKTSNKDPNVESKGYRDDFDMRMGM